MKQEIHTYTEDDILKYMDEELGTWKNFWFTRHLKNCPLCNQIISEYKIIELGLKAKPTISASTDFKPKLLHNIAAEQPLAKVLLSKEFKVKWSYALAAIFILLILTFSFSGIKPQDLVNGTKFFAISTNPALYIKTQHFIQENLAILSIFRTFVTYVVVGLISAWGLFFMHKRGKYETRNSYIY